ncbi:MAG: DUF4157 domain-containing protein [Rubrivivax sp.]|nr:DUF4157 domain-containing protein [Rubrivivax sp.]
MTPSARAHAPKSKPAAPAEKSRPGKGRSGPPTNPAWAQLSLGGQRSQGAAGTRAATSVATARTAPAPRRASRVSIMRSCACNGSCPRCSGQAQETLQRQAGDSGGAGATGPDYARLSRRAHGRGSPLDGTTLDFMQSRFGQRFDGVRVHHDDFAAQQARALGATAFTLGQDLFFAAGAYQPGSRSGLRLLAHELAHTVQQRGAASAPALGPHSVSRPGDELEREADVMADRVLGDGRAHISGRSGGPVIARDITLPDIGLPDVRLPTVADLREGAAAVVEAGSGLVNRGAEAVAEAASGAAEAIEWVATEAGQLALAEAQALAGLLGGSVIVRGGCVVIRFDQIQVFASFQKTLGSSPPVGFFVPLIEGGAMLGPVPVVGMAGLMAYAQLSAEAAVGPGVVRNIEFQLCPFSRRLAATAQFYAAAALAPRLTLFGGGFGAVGTAIPTTPPIPLVLIAQAGLRGTGTGWGIGAVQDTVTVEYRAGTLRLDNLTELMAGYLLQGDLDFFAALRLYSKILCQYVHPIKHWQTGQAWKLSIPLSARYGPGGGSGAIGPITWGTMPIGDIETAIRPLPTGWDCLSWQEIKAFMCENHLLPPSLCDSNDGGDGDGGQLQRLQLAMAICKCVGDDACGGGKIYRRCFTVEDKVCKDKGKLQKAADDKCNNTPAMKELCKRPKCYYRHTDAKCPVEESECDGKFDNGGGQAEQDCAVPVNFRQTAVSEQAGGTLRFNYAWDSSTGDLADLTDVGVSEKVDYPGSNDPFIWPSPPWTGDVGTPNPTLLPNPPVPGTRGRAVDNHSTLPFLKPYRRASFTARQVYRYATPCKNGGRPVALSPNINIVRVVKRKPDGNFQYRITKSGSSAGVDPLP